VQTCSRIQAAMLDEHSLTVTYNDWRGEPRSRHAKKAAAAGQPVGDCVDCNACVAVCPMGIDIRDGQQLECITCALCIDACDGVMDKLNRDRGLISYATLADYNQNMALATAGGTSAIDPKRIRGRDGRLLPGITNVRFTRIVRPRTMVYFAAWSLVGLALLYGLMTRDRLQVNVLHDRNPQFVLLSDGAIRNGYTVKLLNKIPEPRAVVISLEGLPDAAMSAVEINEPASRKLAVTLEPDRLRTLKIFVAQPAAAIASSIQSFRFVVEDPSSFEADSYTASFEAPQP
jgi:cytochrome c oxidase accessory protein FixG